MTYVRIGTQPTLLQKRAMKIYIGGAGRISLSESMRRAGFSVETSRTPSNLRNMVGWKQLVEEYFPDETILRAHERGLNAKTYTLVHKEVKTVDNNGVAKKEFKNVAVEVDDMAIQLKALDMVYKVLDKYPKDKAPIQINNFSLADMAKMEDAREKKGLKKV